MLRVFWGRLPGLMLVILLYYIHRMATDEIAPYCGAKGAAISITQADALDVSSTAV